MRSVGNWGFGNRKVWKWGGFENGEGWKWGGLEIGGLEMGRVENLEGLEIEGFGNGEGWKFGGFEN